MRKAAEASGNTQNGSTPRLRPTHVWPAMTTTAAANTGRRDSGSVALRHPGKVLTPPARPAR